MRAVRWVAAGAAVTVAAWVSIDQLRDAYGAGPPYYSRTVNMDKWTSPWGTVLTVDGVMLALAIWLIATRGRARKNVR